VGDDLKVSYFDGTSWRALDTLGGASVTDPGFKVRAGTLSNPGAYNDKFKVRLQSNGTGIGYDDFYIDDFDIHCMVTVGGSDTGDTGDSGGSNQWATSLLDDFEGGYDKLVWTSVSGDGGNSTAYSASGTGSLNLGGGGATAESIEVDLSGCAAPEWSYMGKRGPEAPDASDSLKVQVFNGVDWTEVDSWAGQGTVDPSFKLRFGVLDSATLPVPTRVRVIAAGSGNSFDDYFIDDLRVGCPNGGSPGQILLFDDFESGTFETTIWKSQSALPSITTSYTASGQYAVDMMGTGETIVSVAVDASICSQLEWSYEGKRGPEKPDSSDYLRLEMGSTSTMSVQILDTWYGNGSIDADFSTRTGIVSNPSDVVTFTFRSQGSGLNFDNYFIDDFLVECL
jgi:hypothetical protein